MASILQEAQTRWPEDEAFGLFCDLIEGDDPADDAQIARQVAHMHTVFHHEPDAAELIARFDARLAELVAEKNAAPCYDMFGYPLNTAAKAQSPEKI